MQRAAALPRAASRPCQAPFDLPEFLRLRRNYPTISETLPALEYLHPPSLPRSRRRSPPAGGRGLFKLKSRQDLNFKISIWLANLSASFRPRESERPRFRLLLETRPDCAGPTSKVFYVARSFSSPPPPLSSLSLSSYHPLPPRSSLDALA